MVSALSNSLCRHHLHDRTTKRPADGAKPRGVVTRLGCLAIAARDGGERGADACARSPWLSALCVASRPIGHGAAQYSALAAGSPSARMTGTLLGSR
jgi:hypothetical protein